MTDIHSPVLCCYGTSVCAYTRHSRPFCRELHSSEGWKHCALFARTALLLPWEQVSFLTFWNTQHSTNWYSPYWSINKHSAEVIEAFHPAGFPVPKVLKLGSLFSMSFTICVDEPPVLWSMLTWCCWNVLTVNTYHNFWLHSLPLTPRISCLVYWL